MLCDPNEPNQSRAGSRMSHCLEKWAAVGAAQADAEPFADFSVWCGVSAGPSSFASDHMSQQSLLQLLRSLILKWRRFCSAYRASATDMLGSSARLPVKLTGLRQKWAFIKSLFKIKQLLPLQSQILNLREGKEKKTLASFSFLQMLACFKMPYFAKVVTASNPAGDFTGLSVTKFLLPERTVLLPALSSCRSGYRETLESCSNFIANSFLWFAHCILRSVSPQQIFMSYLTPAGCLPRTFVQSCQFLTKPKFWKQLRGSSYSSPLLLGYLNIWTHAWHLFKAFIPRGWYTVVANKDWNSQGLSWNDFENDERCGVYPPPRITSHIPGMCSRPENWFQD